MTGPYHTDTFENIPAEKRERILRAASRVLGRDGVSGARMAVIAKEAGISHGSLFSYFPTKDDLVRAVVERGFVMEKDQFKSVEGAPFGEILAAVLERAWDTARDEPELISLWLSFSLMENERFAADVIQLERDAAMRWADIIETARGRKDLGRGIDPRVASFLVDAAVAQLMKSRTSALEREKFAMLFDDADKAPGIIARGLGELLGRKD